MFLRINLGVRKHICIKYFTQRVIFKYQNTNDVRFACFFSIFKYLSLKEAIEIRRASFLFVAVVHRTLFSYLFLAITQLYAKSNFFNQSDSNLATFFRISFFFSTFFF